MSEGSLFTARCYWICGSDARLTALHVSHTLDDETVTHAHQIHTANGTRIVVAPAKTPQDRRAFAADHDIFEVEARAGCGNDALPQLETGFAADVARTVRRRCGILEHTIGCDQIVEQRRIVQLECIVETTDHCGGSGFDGRFHRCAAACFACPA